MKLIMRVIGDAATEPVTIGQLRDHVRADGPSDDAALIGYGVSARALIEQWLGRPIVPQTVRGICEEWPATGGLELSMPVTAVDLVTYTNEAQVVTTWTAGAAGWLARVSQGGVTRIRPATGIDWPTLGDDPVITVNSTAGFASVPEPINTAICKLAGYLHADRDGMGEAGMGVGKLPGDVRELIRPWRFGGFLA
jgi:uncharacterized phiE125 gp8 family phage protein